MVATSVYGDRPLAILFKDQSMDETLPVRYNSEMYIRPTSFIILYTGIIR